MIFIWFVNKQMLRILMGFMVIDGKTFKISIEFLKRKFWLNFYNRNLKWRGKLLLKKNWITWWTYLLVCRKYPVHISTIICICISLYIIHLYIFHTFKYPPDMDMSHIRWVAAFCNVFSMYPSSSSTQYIDNHNPSCGYISG